MDFEVSGIQYRSGKMNARQQFHVARKLGPILAKIGPSNKSNLTMIQLLEPAVDALAEMPEKDCDYVLNRCLAVVRRQSGTGWARVFDEQSEKMLFEDIDLAAMIQIAMNVLGDNLGNFIGAPASASTAPPQPGSNTQVNLSPSPMARTG